MKISKYFLVFLFCYGCASTNKSKENGVEVIECNIFEITEFDYAYRLTATDSMGNTILVVSLKDNFYDKYEIKKPDIDKGAKTITVNENYVFKSTRIKPRVSTMEQLGAFIVIETDTLWKASTYKDIPLSYRVYNTVGLLYGE